MAATVTWIGTNGAASDGVISNADSTTGWTALKISGTGGGPSAAVADGQIEGTGAVTCVASKQRVALYYDIGAGNTLDFTGGGNAEGEMIYVWGNFLAAALLNNQSAGGFGIFLESSTPTTTQYHLYYYYGADNYAGGWKRMVLDPNETVSASAGTAIDLTAVRYIGVFGDVGATTARFDNLIADQMMVGKGLTVTGTSTTDDLIADLIADEATNRYGIIQPLNDSDTAVELNGKLVLGDVTAATASALSDNAASIFVAEPTYYDGTSITTSVPVTFFDLAVVGGTGTNSVEIGEAVGTDGGRNGWTITGNPSYQFGIDFDNGSVNTNKWLGCSFNDITGTIVMGTNTAHEFYSNSWTNCSQVDPQGGVKIRNNFFVGTIPVTGAHSAALLWNSSADIQKCQFIANSDPHATWVSHGIEFPAASVGISIIDMLFSGNEKGVWFSATTGNLVLNASGVTDLGATDYTNDSSGSVTVNNNKSVTFTGLKDNSEVRVYLAADGSVVDGIEDATAGTADNRTFAWSAAAGTVVDYVIHNWQPGVTVYESIRVDGYTVPSVDTGIAVQQRVDRNAA